jgi:DinB superfamily
MNLSVVRQELLNTLQGFQAHIPCIKVLADFPVDKINDRIAELPYTAWEIVEHMRITQRDILDYMVSPDYQEHEFPDGYWPERGKKASVEQWNNTVKQFNADMQSLEKIIIDPQSNLTGPIEHNPMHSIFREILIVGNHNSYHSGQLLLIMRLLKIYGS